MDKNTQAFSSVLLQEHEDYELIQSTNPELNKAIVRVNIFHEHRQTIQVSVINIPYNGYY